MSLDINRIETNLQEAIGEAFSQGIQLLGQDTVGKWVIRRGMEFHSPWIWWGDVSKTREDSYGGEPHEGLDFALAEMTESGHIQANMQGLLVPSFTDGAILWSFADLVGDTVIVATEISIESRRLIIQYSHIDFENATIGDSISRGERIGKVKLSSNPKSNTASHLHVSVALIDEAQLGRPDSEVDFKNWLAWDQSGQLVYLDPLKLVSPEAQAKRFILGENAQSPLSCLISTGPSKEDRSSLRRLLARNFPGIQCLGKKTMTEAFALIRAHALLVSIDDRSWKIEYGPELNISDPKLLTGQDHPALIEAISQIETNNRQKILCDLGG